MLILKQNVHLIIFDITIKYIEESKLPRKSYFGKFHRPWGKARGSLEISVFFSFPGQWSSQLFVHRFWHRIPSFSKKLLVRKFPAILGAGGKTNLLKKKSEVVLILLGGTYEKTLVQNVYIFSFPTLYSLCKISALCLFCVPRQGRVPELGSTAQSFVSLLLIVPLSPVY